MRLPTTAAFAFLLITAGLALPGAAPAATPKPRLVLAGAQARSLPMCGHTRHALSAGDKARIAVRLAGTRTVQIARCGSTGKWVPKASVRISGHGRLPKLKPGDYRIRVQGIRPAYLRIKWPLLDRVKARATMTAFCNGPDGTGPRRPASARLPLDPRKLVTPGLEHDGLAVSFNAPWIDLHNAPGFRPHPVQHPETCGDWRQWVADGQKFLETRQFFILLASSRAYDNLWRVWGLKSRPADFDQEVIERYGLNAAPFRNPYPRPGEDPKATHGGSGQLPLGLIQGQNRDLSYNGHITITCSACHDSILGTKQDGLGMHYGRGSDAVDASLFGYEMSAAALMVGETPDRGPIAAAALPFPYSAGRGVTNAFGTLDFLGAGNDMETLDTSPGVELFPDHGAGGQVQTPNWWNRDHRTRMFWGGELSGDNARVSMALAVANLGERTGAEIKALEPNFERVHTFLESLSPPPYPKKVDTKLAERGAVVFHTKDLWADPRNASIPRPPGNGSCASCHGVYSPRYAHDPAFLPDPRLKGIEGNITPIDVIRTDPARTRLVSKEFKRAWDTSWWGYDDLNPKWTVSGQGKAGTTFERALNDYSLRNGRLSGPNIWDEQHVGYEAPPLYGIWASAPYFHNGSVPTVRGVLKPEDRPAVWQRPLAKPSSSGIVQGLDTSFAGYDFQNLGYKYKKIPCDVKVPAVPLITCHPEGSALSVAEGVISQLIGPITYPGNQVPPTVTDSERRRRMIYNTHEYSMGNGGHDFSRVLSDAEVAALLAYLETL